MFAGSIGFAFSSAFALVVASPPPLAMGGGFVSGFFGAAGDFPVSGVFSGSVCACNPNAIAAIKSETKNDFFIFECKASDRINKMHKMASDNLNAPESIHSENSAHSVGKKSGRVLCVRCDRGVRFCFGIDALISRPQPQTYEKIPELRSCSITGDDCSINRSAGQG